LKLDQWLRILGFLEESLHRNPDKSDVCKQEARCQVSVDDIIRDGAFLGPSEDSMMSTASFKILWTPIWMGVPLALPCVYPLVRNAGGLLEEIGDRDGNIEAPIGSIALPWRMQLRQGHPRKSLVSWSVWGRSSLARQNEKTVRKLSISTRDDLTLVMREGKIVTFWMRSEFQGGKIIQILYFFQNSSQRSKCQILIVQFHFLSLAAL
jgi:hypothetical protein